MVDDGKALSDGTECVERDDSRREHNDMLFLSLLSIPMSDVIAVDTGGRLLPVWSIGYDGERIVVDTDIVSSLWGKRILPGAHVGRTQAIELMTVMMDADATMSVPMSWVDHDGKTHELDGHARHESGVCVLS